MQDKWRHLVAGVINSENYLPENRKGGWFNAGYLRFLKQDIIVYEIKNLLEYGATNNNLDRDNNNSRTFLKKLEYWPSTEKLFH